MAITKSSATLASAVTASATQTAVDCSGDYGQEAFISVAVVGTPTVGATVKLQWSPDAGTTYYDSPVYTAGLTAATYYFGPVSIPVTASKVRTVFVQQTGGTSSTLNAQLGQITAI